MAHASALSVLSRRELMLAGAGAAAVLALSPRGLFADDAETKKKYEEIVGKAIEYCKVKGQAEDGSFSSFAGIGPTVLCTTGILRHGRTTADPTVAKAMAYLEKAVQKDGGIYGKGSRFKNYETCVAVMCFKEANKDGKYDETLANADKYLKGLQYDEKNKIESSDFNYGGGGYGEGGRPDLSNTGFLIDALKASGNASDDQAIQKALVFVSRCQNLENEHNTTPLASKVNDGGFYYAITAGGEGRGTDEGGLRSYGSMTYTGLKSLIYAGLKPDDKRVEAATKWISKHYSVKENPNMGDAGLFYYYHTFAKCLDALGQDEITDAEGVKHNWRAELIAELAERQQPDGSWVNKNSRWLEGNANLSTGFALLALSYAKPKS